MRKTSLRDKRFVALRSDRVNNNDRTGDVSCPVIFRYKILEFNLT